MSEEKRDPELNDAELNGVSGGGEYTDEAAKVDAQRICGTCPIGIAKPCAYDSYLRKYIQDIYPQKIYDHIQCPYYGMR